MKNFEECTKKEQIARWENVLRVLQALTPHQRRKHFDMAAWGYKTDCGTIACAAGHCSLDTWFRRRGFKGKLANPNPQWGGKLELRFDDGSESGQFMGGIIVKFFGVSEDEDSPSCIFMNDNARTVGRVIREVSSRIKELTEDAAAQAKRDRKNAKRAKEIGVGSHVGLALGHQAPISGHHTAVDHSEPRRNIAEISAAIK